MKAEEFIAAIKAQYPDRKYLYWDEEHKQMLEITRSICDAEIYYDVVYGPLESFGVNQWDASISDDFVFGGYYHEHLNGHITSEDYFKLKVKNLIPKGMQVEYGDAVAPEQHEKSEKDAMWERD